MIVRCVLCGSDDTTYQQTVQKKGDDKTGQVRQCNGCGKLFIIFDGQSVNGKTEIGEVKRK